MRLGFSRALVEFNNEYKTTLKPHGLLKRDPRAKERKKP
ncbi:MAG: 30S ribosomal protein S9 [Patescibacteria group bacterium]